MKYKKLNGHLPGPGDEATWGRRTPYAEDPPEDPLADYYRTDDDALNGIFIIDPGLYASDDPNLEQQLKDDGYAIINNTPLPFNDAFALAQQPVHVFFCGPGPDRYVSMYVINDLKRLASESGKEMTMTELHLLNWQWMTILLSQQPDV